MDKVSDHLRYETWVLALQEVFDMVEENSPFYLNALHDNFSFFYLHLMRTQRSIMDNIIEELLNGRVIKKEERDFFIDFYTTAYVGTFINWLNDGMREPGSKVIDRLNKIISGTLRSSISNYIK